MATPTPSPDAVATFMRITGAPVFVAVQKLEEYGGNVNEAINAHFLEGDTHIQRQNPAAAPPPQYNYSDTNDQNRGGSRGVLPFLSAVRRFRPSLLLDPNYRRELRDVYNGIGATAFTSHAPNTSHPEQVSGASAGINSAFEWPHQSGSSSTNADMTGNLISHGRGSYGTNDYQNDYSLAQSNASHVSDNDIEEAMIQAAIEASKKVSYDGGLPQSHSQLEDDDLVQALSLSLEMAEQEEAIREHLVKENGEGRGVHDLLATGEKINSSRSTLELGTSSSQNVAQDVAQAVKGHPFSHGVGGHLQGNADAFNSDKWGGISPDELNEALMLETALFGEIPNHNSRTFSSLPDVHHHHPEKNVDPMMQCLSSSTSELLSDAKLLRQQQDAAYLASLRADKQKELNFLKEAETNCLKEDSRKKMLEIKETEKMLDKKEVRLSKEPPLDDENAVAIIVRMPDGSRNERRFLKTDKLQLLFDFIDNCGAVKPGTYRIVKSYPRRAYSVNDSRLTLNEVGLSSKKEALFLELI